MIARLRMSTISSIASPLRAEGPGFAIVPGIELRGLLGGTALRDWDRFANSWNDLGADEYMADGGRFRRRRYARFSADGSSIVRGPHGPHYQGLEYNRLNGGVDRWFEPVTEDIGSHPALRALLVLCVDVFGAASNEGGHSPFHVEMHQFRIEPTSTEIGKPTPEGMHRDGVDWVYVGLIDRTNVAGGVTAIGDNDRRSLGSFTLSGALDSVFLDDRRVRHGVTPIEVLTPGKPAHRDVLVLTFRTTPLP